MKGNHMQDDLFDGMAVEELETPSNTDTSVKDVVNGDVPNMLSPEWHEYAMTLFTEDEMMYFKENEPDLYGLGASRFA